jgi:hypothetical protein
VPVDKYVTTLVTHLVDGSTPDLRDAAVVELRQYTLRPGRRDELVAVFENSLLDPQVVDGMTVGGLFRDLDDSDRFVWQRGFLDMESRRRSLSAFYGGDTWRAHGAAANATMLDSDDVLLLRSTSPPHPVGRSEDQGHDGVVAVGIVSCRPIAAAESLLTGPGHEILRAGLDAEVATWRTDPSPNTFPALPVREDHVFVWQATFVDEVSLNAALARLDAAGEWRALAARVPGWAEHRLRLSPTRRSRHPRPRVEVQPVSGG